MRVLLDLGPLPRDLGLVDFALRLRREVRAGAHRERARQGAGQSGREQLARTLGEVRALENDEKARITSAKQLKGAEICVQSPGVMQGYYNNPELTRQVLLPDGWLKTGDIGRMDDKGFVYIEDRKKDMILVSGFNVYPNEVESVIAKMAGVLEVADVLVVNKADRPDTQATVRDLRAMVALATAAWKPPIVTTVATAGEGIGELVSGFTAVRNQGGELKLLQLTKKVRDLLQITKLYTVFDIYTDESAAIRSFR